MKYLEQPAFGLLVGQLRRDRGLSQAQLAGEGLSASYVSRLESGVRAPTTQAVTQLARRFGVPADTFRARSPQVAAERIAEGVTALEDGRLEAAVAALTQASDEAQDLAAETRWLMLWTLAQAYERLGLHEERRQVATRLLAVGEELGSATLQVKALTELAVCARLVGVVDESVAVAGKALALGEEHVEIPRADIARVLLALIAAEAESGRLLDAAQHAELAQQIPPQELGALRVQVLWSAATVAVRQGAVEQGLALLHQALSIADHRDILTWGRLRTAAVSLHLRSGQEVTPQVLSWFHEAEGVVGLYGSPGHQAELKALAARIAFHQGDRDRASRLAGEVLDDPTGLSLQDRMSVEILFHQIALSLGQSEAAVSALRSVADRLQASGNLDLSAEAWKALAEAALGRIGE
ncbi:transcriptional regulator with XRE-family HTH domain [Streptacidiphilus sp. MAP12-20]|uniref:helix-turn-helix domain-containing protein n=1 Tax=Streptacidiphilus sp. MAP12-20 TaxID=3156299 RepID=UPI003516621A